jgi:hypothetical protein
VLLFICDSAGSVPVSQVQVQYSPAFKRTTSKQQSLGTSSTRNAQVYVLLEPTGVAMYLEGLSTVIISELYSI